MLNHCFQISFTPYKTHVGLVKSHRPHYTKPNLCDVMYHQFQKSQVDAEDMDLVWLTVAVTSIVPVITNAVRYNARVNDQCACDHFSGEETCFFQNHMHPYRQKRYVICCSYKGIHYCHICSINLGKFYIVYIFCKGNSGSYSTHSNSDWHFIKLILIVFRWAMEQLD